MQGCRLHAYVSRYCLTSESESDCWKSPSSLEDLQKNSSRFLLRGRCPRASQSDKDLHHKLMILKPEHSSESHNKNGNMASRVLKWWGLILALDATRTSKTHEIEIWLFCNPLSLKILQVFRWFEETTRTTRWKFWNQPWSKPSESVKRRFSKYRFSAELENRKLRKINSKSLGPACSLCRRAGIDAALVKAQFSFCRCTPHRKSNRIKHSNAKAASG